MLISDYGVYMHVTTWYVFI